MSSLQDVAKTLVSSFPNYSIEIGVLTDKSGRRDKVVIGMNNAELMFVHENGSPLRNIPARPVLEMTIEYLRQTIVKTTLQKCVEAWPDTDAIELELKKLCIRGQNYARHIIYDNDGRLVPNSPSVAKKKGGNHPLFDTGQLARSITCRLLKDGKEKW